MTDLDHLRNEIKRARSMARLLIGPRKGEVLWQEHADALQRLLSELELKMEPPTMSAETKPGREPEAMVLVPREPTSAMHDAARDWSYAKYGKPIGKDASAGCWAAMLAASPAAPAPAGNGVREAATAVIEAATNTYRKRGGQIGTLEGDDGKMMWIVPYDPFEELRAALATPVSAEEDGLRAALPLRDLVWTHMPSYGELSFDQLREAVSEANIGDRHHLGPFDPSYFAGHQRVGGCNYNSLNRIVTAFVRAALATPVSAEEDGLRAAVPTRDAVSHLANVLMAAWRKAEPDHPISVNMTSYTATFADMARAALTPTPAESTKPYMSAAALALPPSEQHALATALAANLGYELVAEALHPDTPAPGTFERAAGAAFAAGDGQTAFVDPANVASTPAESARSCTCHPDDKPPVPCAEKYALTECRAAESAPSGDTVAAQVDVVTLLREYAESPTKFDPPEHLCKLAASTVEAIQRERDEAIETVKRTREFLTDAQHRAGDNMGRALKAEARLQIGPQGDDKIDELEGALEHLRARNDELEASLAQERSKREEAAEDEQDRLLAKTLKQMGQEFGSHYGVTSARYRFLQGEGAMRPSERAAARAARGEQA